MAKFSSISEQISALETDLEQKNSELKSIEKSLDKLLKSLFGMDKKSIEILIKSSQTSTKNPAFLVEEPEGVEEKILY